MKRSWSQLKLGDVLQERREIPSERDLAESKVRIVEKVSFHSGKIHLRAQGNTKTGMILVRPGDLLVSGINAAKGAIAIHDDIKLGPIAATIHYGAYEPNPKQVEIKFLWWMLRSGFFRDLLDLHVPGGIKTELKAKRLLPIPVPIPPLEEQRIIIRQIESVAGQIANLRQLRDQSASECEALTGAVLHQRIGNPYEDIPGSIDVPKWVRLGMLLMMLQTVRM